MESNARRAPRVAIVGGGMSGMGLADRLSEEGLDDFVIYEKADRFGGTWRENTYPGVACDVPSAYYSYSHAQNPDWSHVFAGGEEIQRYFETFAAERDLQHRTRFGIEVLAATWSGDHWALDLSDGSRDVADILVSATGVVHQIAMPDIDGLRTFEGAMFHSARWDHGVAIDGQRVGLIGSGSTGAQILTAVAGRAARLTVFQRTPQWVLSWGNPEIPGWVRRALGRFGPLRNAYRRLVQIWFEHTFGAAVLKPGLRRDIVRWAARWNLGQVRDPELRRALTPDYEPMCRRLVLCDGYYDAIQRDDVALVTDGIVRVEPRGVRTADGRLHELDVLVLATGFDAHAFTRPIMVTGLDGRTLDEEWADGARGHRTVALAGFPNFFMLLGPHSPFGNQSQIMVAETQTRYIVEWAARFARGEWGPSAPSRQAMDAFNRAVRDELRSTDNIWSTGCRSWYLGDDGVPEVWPWSAKAHRTMLATVDPSEWEPVPAS